MQSKAHYTLDTHESSFSRTYTITFTHMWWMTPTVQKKETMHQRSSFFMETLTDSQLDIKEHDVIMKSLPNYFKYSKIYGSISCLPTALVTFTSVKNKNYRRFFFTNKYIAILTSLTFLVLDLSNKYKDEFMDIDILKIVNMTGNYIFYQRCDNSELYFILR